MNKYRKEECGNTQNGNIFDNRSDALIATYTYIHDCHFITVCDDVELEEDMTNTVDLFNDICNELFPITIKKTLKQNEYAISREDLRKVGKPLIDEAYGSREYMDKLFSYWDKQTNKGENKMFDSAQPQWEKVLNKLRAVVIRPMRDDLEYQACINGKIEEDLLDFCQQYESICTHHENPRYFLGEWIELYKTAFKVFGDNAIKHELMDIMVSDEWFDLIRWFDKEYEDFDEE